ncbi:hypothetical protein [Methyloceanibacter sp.]
MQDIAGARIDDIGAATRLPVARFVLPSSSSPLKAPSRGNDVPISE